MSKFTKLPVEIEAERITEKIEIATREGTLFGYPGEWLITGIEGERYPCGDDIFRKTYSPSGKDKCSYCEYSGREGRPCDSYEVCMFKWRSELRQGYVATEEEYERLLDLAKTGEEIDILNKMYYRNQGRKK